MGARGVKAMASNVRSITGNVSKLPSNRHELLDGFQPLIEIPDCPPHLLPEARKEWRRITPELERYGLISKIDRAALALYCAAWSRWVWAEKMLARAQAAAAAAMKAADDAGKPYTGGDGITLPTPSGHVTYSPHWVIANKAQEQVHRYLESFGMRPDARSRVTLSRNRQAEMFDNDDDTDQDVDDEGFNSL